MGLARPIRATRVTFLILGIVLAAWAPLVPDLKLRLGLGDAGLGFMLLAAGAGSLLVAPFAGMAVARFGCRRVILPIGMVFCAALPALTLLPGIPLAVVALAVLGGTTAVIDVAMNMQAVVVEREAGRAMMSGFHGLFSGGALVGAGAMSAFLYFGVDPPVAGGIVAVVAGLLLVSQGSGLLPRAEAPAAAMGLPRGRLALIGGLCFLGFMAEGAVHDWSAVLLRFHRDASPAVAGLAYAAFAVAMTAGRLAGDAILRRFAAVVVLRWGGLLAAGGFLLMTGVPGVPAALIGCVLIGLGEANIVPALFSAAAKVGLAKMGPAKVGGADPGHAIAAVATPGYVGLLLGPALIGLAARATSLPMALAGTGLLLLAVTATAHIATRETSHA